MDIGLLTIAAIDLIGGVLGLFGIQSVPKKYKGKSWTRAYMREMAFSELLMAVLLVVVVLATRGRELSIPISMLLIAVAVIPSLIWGILIGKKYDAKLRDGIE